MQKKALSRIQKTLMQHGRTWSSAAIGFVVFFVLPHDWPVLTRLLVSWNTCVVLFLGLIYTWMFRLTAQQICDRFIDDDETAPAIIASGVVAALLSLAAIIEFLSTLDHSVGLERTVHIALAALTVVTSWLVVPTLFTLHYADLFYSEKQNARPLHFPASSAPVFWDFIYFSFTISAACQTADVSTTCTSIRKVVIAHTLISFLFNASILGFAINVSAGLFSQ